MTAHARLGASKADRWMHCPGSVRLTDGLPDEETEYAREGTRAHEYASTILLGNAGRWDLKNDAEMLQHVHVYTEYVNRRTDELAADTYIEKVVHVSDLPAPMFGTADAILVGADEVEVVDFKYGQGVVVDVRDDEGPNRQLMYYLLGAVLNLNLDMSRAQAHMRVTVVQPRAPHADGVIRSTVVTFGELVDFERALTTAADATRDPSAPLVPGKWCRFCPAAAHCPALYRHAQLTAQMDFDAVPIDTPPAPERLPLAVCADLLGKTEVLETWVNALRARVTAALERGEPVPGWKLVARRPRRRWADEKELKRWARAAGLKPSELVLKELKSPAQLEAVIGKQYVPPELYVSESSGLTLARDADPRPAAAIGPEHDFAALPPAALDAQIGGQTDNEEH